MLPDREKICPEFQEIFFKVDAFLVNTSHALADLKFRFKIVLRDGPHLETPNKQYSSDSAGVLVV